MTAELSPLEIATPERQLANHAAVWAAIVAQARAAREAEPPTAEALHVNVLSYDDLGSAIGCALARRLGGVLLQERHLYDLAMTCLTRDPDVLNRMAEDLDAAVDRNPAYVNVLEAFLFSKGFMALSAYRIAHQHWHNGERLTATMIETAGNEVLGLDIHPAARIEGGVFVDHATGVVIGETAAVGTGTSILQSVTLGGTGKECGDRHPKVGRDVLIGAGAVILGNIRVGDGSRIGAGSVVLTPVPDHATAVGVPARIVQRSAPQAPGRTMDYDFSI